MTELQTVNNYLKKLNAAFTITGGTDGSSVKLKETDGTEHQVSLAAFKQLSEEADADYKTEKATKEASGDAKLQELLNAAKGNQPGDDNGQDGKD